MDAKEASTALTRISRILAEESRGERKLRKREREQIMREYLHAWAAMLPIWQTVKIDSRKVARPLPHPIVTADRNGQYSVCSLELDGKLVGEWNDDAVPWLHDWLLDHLPTLFSAWQVARVAAASHEGATAGGRTTGKRTSAVAKANEAEISKELDKLPSEYKREGVAGLIADRRPSLGKRDTIRKKLPPRKS